MSYKIISTEIGHGKTKVVDTETGEEIKDIVSIDWHIDAEHMVGIATIRLLNVEMDCIVAKDGVELDG